MINRFANYTSRMAVALVMMLTVTACGGGGGGGSDGGFLGDAGNTDTYFLDVQLLDPNGNQTSTVTSNAPATVRVRVTKNKRSGSPIAEVIVTASADVGLLFPEAGTRLTNTDGVAEFRLESGGGKGAGSVNVSVSDESGQPVAETITFQLGATGLRLGSLNQGVFSNGQIAISPAGAISSQGEAILTVAIVDENDELVGSTESVSISSTCLSTGAATLNPASPIAVVSGSVTIEYTDVSCEGTDAITAELIGEGAQAFGDIEIAPRTASGLTFISAEPDLMVLKGTGGGPDRVDVSTLTFRTVDAENDPLAGLEVNFKLSTDAGGLTLSPASATSDADGNVFVTVSAGDVPTVVRVEATTEAGNGVGQVSAVSDVLTVSTGLPDQNSISLSVEGGFVVEQAMNMDGITRTLTVRMADKFNNPVPNGTAAVFTTEYGSIDPSCETGRRNGDRLGSTPEVGQCSVQWQSQNPRFPTLDENQALVTDVDDPSGYNCPSHNGSSGPCPDDLGRLRVGRSTVLVTAIGEESFVDRNGNGVFDESEADDGLFSNLSEAFLDHNENGLFDPATQACNSNPSSLSCRTGSEEIFTDFNNNQMFDANGDEPSNGYPNQNQTAVFNGLLCPEEGDINVVGPQGWCSRELLNVRSSTLLILSNDNDWRIALYQGRFPVSSTSFSGGTYTAYVSDRFNNRPPAGSTISVAATGPCLADGSMSVGATSAPGASTFQFSQGGDISYDSCNEQVPNFTGELTITLSPSGGGPDHVEMFSCRADLIDTSVRDALGNCP